MSRARRLLLAGAVLAALVPVAPVLAGAGSAPTLSDPLPGSTRLPNGWRLDPAGTQVTTDRAPTGLTVSPDGTTVYAVTSGIFTESVDSINATTLTPTPTLIGEAYQGVADDAAGDVWVAGGPANAVFQYRAVGPALVDLRQAGPAPSTPNRGIPVRGYPGNMLLDPSGHRLFVAGSLSDHGSPCPGQGLCSLVSVIDVSDPTAPSPSVREIPVGRDAYGLAYRPASQTLYVSNMADQTDPARKTGTVSVVDVGPSMGGQQQVVPVGLGPTGVALSPDGGTLAVANSGSDTVSLLTLATNGVVTATTTVPVGLPGAPPGTTPVAVAYAPDGHLLVALAGLDAVEVLAPDGSAIPQQVTVDYAGRPHTLVSPATYVPTGWYPDAMAVAAGPATGTTRLYVANLRGDGAGPGYYGQLQPTVGSSTEGTVSAIDLPGPAAWQREMNAWTARVVAADQLAPVFDSALADPATNACLPPNQRSLLCLAQQGRVDPRTLHVVVILAENKTFDAYFGDTGTMLRNANADPQWTEYGAAVTTNQHRLAEQFSLDDNFWNEGAESSVLGHSWLTGGYSTVNNELNWGQEYDQGLRGNRGSSSDAAVNAQESVMFDPRQRVADQIADPTINTAGLTERIYSTDLNLGSAAVGYQIPVGYWGLGGSAAGPTHVDTDLAFPDVDRANIFLHGQTVSHAWDALQGPPPSTFGTTISLPQPDQDPYTLDGWERTYASCVRGGGTDASCQQSSMPNYVYMTLSENHTYDVSNVFNPLDPTPQSMVADNDYAIGLIMQGLSHSPFWRNTLVFVTEDDNQFTGDHVDIHRTFLLTAGGLANDLGSQGLVATEAGSFPSVLKTTEVLLHLPALTLFDWRAAPLQQMVRQGAPADPQQSVPTYSAVLPATPFLSSVDPPTAAPGTG